jgi:tight adherence protein B
MRDDVARLRALATTCHTVALMLRAGLTPDRALHVAGAGPDSWGCAREEPSPESMVAAVWDFSLERGLAPGSVMLRLAEFVSVVADRQREGQLHMVGPRAATRLILWLPAVSVLLASASGFAVLPFLFGTVFGWVLLLLGAVLMLCARLWSNRLLLRASASSWAVGIPAAVLAQCLRAGVAPPLEHELARLISAEGYRTSVEAGHDLAAAFEVVEHSQEWGVPAAALLEAHADLAQRTESQRMRELGERLAVSILIPLGTCVLPAFVLVGVAPIVAVMLSSTALS